MANNEVPFQNNMKFGKGFNRLTGEVLASPAVKGSVSVLGQAGGQVVKSDCVTIQDVTTLHEQLGIDIAASGSHGPLSGNAKVQFANECDFSTFSTYVVVRVSVENAFESFDDPVFTADAEELLINNNSTRFRARFGDCYIHGLKKGGEFFAIYQMTSTSKSERQSLAVEVNAAFDGVVTSAELAAKVRTAKSQSASHLEVGVHVFRQGAISGADLDRDDIMKTAKGFPLAVAGANAFPFSVTVQNYTALRSPNDQFNFIEIANQQDVLADLMRKRFEFLELRDDYSYVLKHPADFENPDGTAVDPDVVDRMRLEIVSAINTMQREAVTCSRQPGQCAFTEFDAGRFESAKPRLKQGAGTPPPPPANAMPNLTGQLAQPIISLLACVNLEGVDHCLNFLRGELNGLGVDPRALANFFFQVTRSGVTPEVRGDASRPGARIKSQFPAPGVPVEPLSTMRFEVTQ
ncbi:hypothetical protein FHS29_007108 [Saccharothrix tamanrassetensis]|uniref:Uncharacterized protein n=1 Tax=Saccharothrix tamanrassetensis TaxID=1051531 RepID=A0A841CW08_9PSEU|nr:hypothetical protein [Saccharothrix tamanrassetensis]MBB5960484.1 hypothetical protein [Saccharothrix tamanrassetensis]